MHLTLQPFRTDLTNLRPSAIGAPVKLSVVGNYLTISGRGLLMRQPCTGSTWTGIVVFDDADALAALSGGGDVVFEDGRLRIGDLTVPATHRPDVWVVPKAVEQWARQQLALGF